MRYTVVIIILAGFITRNSIAQVNLESSESRALSSANLTASETGTLNINPALDAADSNRNLRLSLTVVPNEQGLEKAFVAATEGVYYSDATDLSFSLGASTRQFSDIYSELDGWIGATKQFQLSDLRSATVGGRFRYETVSFNTNYQPLHSYLLDIGLSFDVTSEFAIGAAAVNLFSATYSGTDDPRPQSFYLGATYRPVALGLAIHTTLEEQQRPDELILHIAAEYAPIEYLIFRLGTSSTSGEITAGAGLIYEPIVIDITVRYYSAFGLITAFGISGRW